MALTDWLQRFVYLLERMPAARVARDAYVNPVIAVGQGYFVAAELITPRTLIGVGLLIRSFVLTLAKVSPERVQSKST